MFVSRGYAGARIDDIALAAGVSHGTFYQYFKNKNDLAHVLVLEAMRPLADGLRRHARRRVTRAGSGNGNGSATALRRWLKRLQRQSPA